MWYLIDLATNQKTPYLLSNRIYKIGRKNPVGNTSGPLNDIQIESDQTVSRTHAEILIKFDEKKCDEIEQKAHIILTDNSKFGTFVNNVKVDGFKQLNQNDIIKFGVNNTSFKLCYEPLIVTTSCISQIVKSSIRKQISKLCGYLVNDWRNDCSFVVMDEITVTVKCINALLCQKLIITHKYIDDLVQKCSDFTTNQMPDPINYIPPIGEANLNPNEIDFKPCLKRKTLFKNKKFIFLSTDQLDKMQNIIELAGGECEMFNKTVHLYLKNVQSNKNIYLFLLDPSGKSSENESKIQSLLEFQEQRMIEDTEIGLAILYSSLKQYCNASYLPGDHASQTRKISKITSQTQDFAFDNQMECNNHEDDEDDDDEDEKSSRKRHHISEILDSAQFQYENKCTDLMVVTETQNISNTSINKDLIVDVSIVKEPEVKVKKLNEIVVPDTQDNDDDAIFVKPSEPKKQTPPLKKSHTSQVFIDEPSPIRSNDQTTRLTSNNSSVKHSLKYDDDDSQLQKENKIQKTTSRKATLTSTFKDITVKKEAKPLNESSIKTESVSIHEKLPSKIYSKEKPPKESFLVKTESQEEQITSSNLIKIKFESLVKKEYKFDITNTASSSASSTSGKVNFKKFKKVPKLLNKSSQPTNNSVNSNNNNNNNNSGNKSLFKNFKSEPFDVDSQFEQFMSQMR